MDQSEGFLISRKEDKVCKSQKSLHGLKQEPKQWHMKFDNTLTSNDFLVSDQIDAFIVNLLKMWG